MPLPPHEHTERSASGPVPPAHSTPTTRSEPPLSVTTASSLPSSTTRNVTRPAPYSARPAATKSRANHEPTVAGKRDRQTEKGVNRPAAAPAARLQRADRLPESSRTSAFRDCRRLLRPGCG